MNHLGPQVTLAIIIVLSSMAVPGVATPQSKQNPQLADTEASIDIASTTLTGVVLAPRAEIRNRWMERMDEFTGGTGFESRETVYLLERDGQDVIVFADDRPWGEVSVHGEMVPDSLNPYDTPVLFATSAQEFDPAATIDVADLQQNPSDYYYQSVYINAHHQQLTWGSDASDQVVRHQVFGWLSDEQIVSSRVSVRPIGEQARFGSINLSNTNDAPRRVELNTALGTDRDGLVTSGRRSAFWFHSSDEQLLEAIILPPDETESPGDPEVHVIAGVPRTMSTPTNHGKWDESPPESPSFYSITGDYLGVRISAKESLLRVVQCAPESITPAGFGCVPLVTDVSIHAGVLYGEDRNGESFQLYVLGISNMIQERPIRRESGNYTIYATAKPVSEVLPDSDLSGTVLVPKYMFRNGEIDSPSDDVISMRDRIRDHVNASVVEPYTGNGSNPLRRFAGQDGIIDIGELNAVVEAWATGDVSLRTLSRAVEAWASQEEIG